MTLPQPLVPAGPHGCDGAGWRGSRAQRAELERSRELKYWAN
jgi:hypothetical protein